jgi:hypothetical protein
LLQHQRADKADDGGIVWEAAVGAAVAFVDFVSEAYHQRIAPAG